MKNNRNNRDKLNDALGMVDEELLQDAMLHVEGMGAAHLSRRAVMRRRVAITAAACLGRNKLNIYTEKNVFQFKGNKRFNALKYVNLYFRHRNIIRGEENGKFLGL